MRARGARALLTGGFAALVVAASASAGTLDQEQTDAPNFVNVGTVCPMLPPCSERSRAQTFTPDLSGSLDRVDLVLSHDEGTAPITVEIRTVAPEGCPSTTVLASQAIGPAGVPSPDVPSWVAVLFANPATITAGDEYAIVVYTESGTRYNLGGSFGSDDPYGSGHTCFSESPPTWEASAGDVAFKTYVAEPRATCRGQEATLIGTTGDDTLLGTPGKDVIVGLEGSDLIKGFGANDRLCGGKGKDKLKGGGGKDNLKGANGRDRLIGGGGRDKCAGGKGNDSARQCEVERSI